MDKNYQNWMLIIEKGSQISATNGVYQLKSIINCKEMAILPKFPRR
jgi:hypothetical protein